MSTAIAVALLAAVLVFATVRPKRLPEALVAVPAAVLLVLIGVVPSADARAVLRALGPTVGFLAAVLVLAHAADRAGVFGWAGTLAARASGGGARRLLGVVFAIASITTATLSLDATVVLLTPVVLITATSLGVRPKPHVYACGHLANSASLLLPVANLTNLLAFAASGLGFVAFAGRMALPWAAAIAVEYAAFRWFFRGDLAAPAREPAVVAGAVAGGAAVPAAPRFALVVLAATLVGFALLEPLGVHPAWVALAGALAIGARDVADSPGERWRVIRRLAGSANLAFCAFVLALGVVVLAVSRSGLGRAVARITPHTETYPGLLAAAAIAAIVANILNNLPATLLMVPLVAHSPGLVLAVLIGVNIGPNLTYVGSLATLLWREVLHARDHAPDTRTFLRLGALTVPACLLAAVSALWLSLRVLG